MPKYRRKEKKTKGGREGKGDTEEDSDVDSLEDLSVASQCSDRSYVDDLLLGDEFRAAAAEGNEGEETSAQTVFEDKVKDAVELLFEKSAKTRESGLLLLKNVLQRIYFPDFILERKETIAECLQKCLKRGGVGEQCLTCHVIELFFIQLRQIDPLEAEYAFFFQSLQTIIADPSMPAKARASSCRCLGLLTLLAASEPEQLTECMTLFDKVFAPCYRQQGTGKTASPDQSALSAAAVSSWTLLSTIVPSREFSGLVRTYLGRLFIMLDHNDLDVRIAVGEAIALFYELSYHDDENFEDDNFTELCQKLKSLATDGTKYRAKRDRRVQRSNFRDILRTVEDGESPYLKVRFGVEDLEIDNWPNRKHYDFFCRAVGAGINRHLSENEHIRDFFGLGSPILMSAANPSSKMSKRERNLSNANASKLRTKSRNKHRDKRADFYTSPD